MTLHRAWDAAQTRAGGQRPLQAPHQPRPDRPPSMDGPTGGALRPEQLQRAAANRLRALERRAANLERESKEAEARAAGAAAEAGAREEESAARGLGVR